MAPSVQEEPGNERDARWEECEKRSEEHIFKHGCVIPHYFTNNVWIRQEAARRYGASVGGKSLAFLLSESKESDNSN